jgi:hypothetical protein
MGDRAEKSKRGDENQNSKQREELIVGRVGVPRSDRGFDLLRNPEFVPVEIERRKFEVTRLSQFTIHNHNHNGLLLALVSPVTTFSQHIEPITLIRENNASQDQITT